MASPNRSAVSEAALLACLAGALGGLVGCGPKPLASVYAGPPPPPGTQRVREAVDGLEVGHRLMAAGEYELALRAYLRGAAEQGATVDVLSALGSANLRLGRLGQAEDLLRRALEVDQGFVPAWNNLGVVLLETGRAAEARLVFRTAFALDSGRSAAIGENLRRALAKVEDLEYPSPNDNELRLVRRGQGRFLILATP